MKTFTPDGLAFHYTQWDTTKDVYNGMYKGREQYISCYQQHLNDGIVNHCCYSDDACHILGACRDAHVGCVGRLLPLVKKNELRTVLEFAVFGRSRAIIDMIIGRIKELKE